jgi:hypothetical protein
LSESAALDGSKNERLQCRPLWRHVHAQQRSTVAPSLQVLLQKLWLAVADQHGFEEAIRQLQASITQRKL